jgi:hypothetical protein
MDVVRHQAVSQDARAGGLGMAVEECEVAVEVVVGKEDRLAVVAALGDVVSDFGDYDAWSARHTYWWGERVIALKKMRLSPFRGKKKAPRKGAWSI